MPIQDAKEKTLPTQSQIMPIFMEILLERGSITPPEMVEILADRFALTEEQLALKCNSRKDIPKFYNAVCWVRNKLADKGLVDRSFKGIWKLTADAGSIVKSGSYEFSPSSDKSNGDESTESAIAKEDYREPHFEQIVSSIKEQGLLMKKETILRYHCSLKSRHFVIVSGVSGSGKTWLAQAYAQAIDARSVVVAVSPSWTSNEDLVGYLNPLDNVYRDTDFSLFLRECSEHYDYAIESGVVPRPYHLILDEMNLARVEYYFAKFLSAMEIGSRNQSATIELGAESIVLPPNLFVVGTVNVDETVQAFSDKVFDRAQLIEICTELHEIAERMENEPYKEMVVALWECVKPVAPFSFRTIDDIRSYIREAGELGISWEGALDHQIVQKILPKINGSKVEVGAALRNIISLVPGFPLTKTKSVKMLESFENYGFCSYF
ncbi:MAG: AAA family ATPase [Candidatus Obscuribacterales bacterium]|nr:AAA family ATPase [Candidatus Obscuribacterales bacterium]